MVYWLACYKDGRQLKQSVEAKYEELERDKLYAFVLMFQDKDILTIWLDDDRQLIWRLRREVKPGKGEQRMHLAGWREKVGDRTVQTLCYIFEQYNKKGVETIPLIHIAGKFDRERNRFMYESNLRKFEVFKGETYYKSRIITGPDGNPITIQEEFIKE